MYYAVGHAMAQAVSRWPVAAKARVCALFSPYGIFSGQSDTGIGFLRVLCFTLSVSFHRVSQLLYTGLFKKDGAKVKLIYS
jgi:hypothetical protein